MGCRPTGSSSRGHTPALCLGSAPPRPRVPHNFCRCHPIAQPHHPMLRSHGGMTRRVSELGAVMLKHRLTPVGVCMSHARLVALAASSGWVLAR